MTKHRHRVFLKQVPFADGTVYKVESDVLRAYIVEKVMDALLPFDEGLCVLRTQFPAYPINGFIQCCFEWILRYTYVQHNYLLFAFHIPEQFDCKDIEIAMKIGRNCVCMINKYTYEIFIVNFRFSDEVFKGTLLDGILIKDNCIYPDYFEFTLFDGEFDETKHKERLNEIILELQNNVVIESQPNESQPNESQPNESQPNKNNTIEMSEIEMNEMNEMSEKEIIVDRKRLKENFEKAMKEKDYDEVFKQQRMPSRHMFYVQAVYQLGGAKIQYSSEKLVDSISYKTLLRMQSFLAKNWINDEWFQPFELKNCVDTMYYTRHTQVDLRNPFHNDYLRYQPNKTSVPDDDETQLYDHFIPKMTSNGQLWKDAYYLSGKTFECVLRKSEFPYVYELVLSKKTNINQNHKNNENEKKYAKLMTLEHHRYVRVILNKIHTDKTKPLRIMCKRVHCIKTGKAIAWTPVFYGQIN